jgi:hypothetical protein
MDMGHLPETPEVVVEVDVVGDTAHEHPISLWKQLSKFILARPFHLCGGPKNNL